MLRKTASNGPWGSHANSATEKTIEFPALCLCASVSRFLRSKNSDWIHGRSTPAFDGNRRERQHELVAFQTSSGGGQVFEVEVLHDSGAEPAEQRVVYGVSGNPLVGAPAGTGIPVDVHVVRGKRDVAFLEERNRVGVVAGDLSGP